MRDNPYLAAGTPLGDDYRRRLEQMEIPEPDERIGPFRGVTAIVLFLLAMVLAFGGAGIVLFALPRGEWGQLGAGVGAWGVGVVLALTAYILVRHPRS